jgi:flagellar assembly factor FliW
MTIESRRFGRIEAQEEQIFHFDGLPGFADAKRFVLLRHHRDSPFEWLICVDDPELGFVVTDPRQFFPSYPDRPSPELHRAIGQPSEAPIDLLAIVQLRDGEPSLNLMAPLVLDPETHRGAQVILEGSAHELRTPLPKPKAKASED